MIRKRTTGPSRAPQADTEQIARQIVLHLAGQRKPLWFGTPTGMTRIMCEKCEEIDKRIARYQRVLLTPLCQSGNSRPQAVVEIANTVEAVQDGQIHVEKINWPFLQTGGSADEYVAGLQMAIDCGWLEIHRSGTYVKFTQAGAKLFA